MGKKSGKEIGIPKYQQIAADIAYKIVDGTYTAVSYTHLDVYKRQDQRDI